MSTYKVFVGNLQSHVTEEDIHDAFMKYGDVDKIIMKERFAFVHMLDSRDAEDAIRGLDGRSLAGCDRIRVEKPRDSRRPDTVGVANCYTCGKPGHIARECPQDSRGRADDRRGGGGYDNRDGGNRGSSGCFNCGESGHIARECDRRGRNDRGYNRYEGRGGGSGYRDDRRRGYSRSRSRSRSPDNRRY